MKKKVNFIIRNHQRMLKACVFGNIVAFAITAISLIPFYHGEAINFNSYKILLTAITIMEFIFATLISTALDQSTDKPEELEKK